MGSDRCPVCGAVMNARRHFLQALAVSLGTQTQAERPLTPLFKQTRGGQSRKSYTKAVARDEAMRLTVQLQLDTQSVCKGGEKEGQMEGAGRGRRKGRSSSANLLHCPRQPHPAQAADNGQYPVAFKPTLHFSCVAG